MDGTVAMEHPVFSSQCEININNCLFVSQNIFLSLFVVQVSIMALNVVKYLMTMGSSTCVMNYFMTIKIE